MQKQKRVTTNFNKRLLSVIYCALKSEKKSVKQKKNFFGFFYKCDKNFSKL